MNSSHISRIENYISILRYFPLRFYLFIYLQDYIAVAAFSYFGLKTLYDASQLSDGDNSGIAEEKEDAEKTVEELKTENENRNGVM